MLVEGLWFSLNRVGGQFDDQCILEPEQTGYKVLLKLKDVLPDEAKPSIREYIKAYADIAGWHVPVVTFATRYVRFRLTKASSIKR